MLDRMMDDDFDFKEFSNGETVKENSVYTNQNGAVTKKHVKSRIVVNNGSPEETKL